MKANYELGQLPILVYHGKRMAQSYAILQFLGREFGYLPTSPEENYKMVSLMNIFEDLFGKIVDSLSPYSKYDEAAKKQLAADLEAKDLPLILGVLEKCLADKPEKDYLIGEELCVADFYVMGLWTQFQTVPPAKSIIDKYQGCPLLKAYIQKRMSSIQPQPPPNLKLYDLGTTYKGDVMRLLFQQAKIPFEDIKIKQEEWPSQKNNFPQKQLPVLEVRGHKKVQTNAIMHALGIKFEYLPMCPCKYSKTMELMGIIDDLASGFGVVMNPNLGEETKKKMVEELEMVKVPTLMGALEKRLKENKCQEFFIGRKYTLADFYMISACRQIQKGRGDKAFQGYMKLFPALKLYAEKRMIDFS
jgi:glutathione S-transferase